MVQLTAIDCPVLKDELFDKLKTLFLSLNLQVSEHGVVREKELSRAGQASR